MNRLPRAEIVLPIVIVFAAIVLAASELMTAFQFTPPGGEPLKEVSNVDRHHYAMLVLALGAIVATGVAIGTGARAAAYAVAGFGAVALLLFLIIDLPDAGKLGDLEDPIRGFASAKAVPQSGFWLEAIGAVFLALAGGAFATLTSEQLQTPLTRFRGAGSKRAAKAEARAKRGEAEPRRRKAEPRAKRGRGKAKAEPQPVPVDGEAGGPGATG